MAVTVTPDVIVELLPDGSIDLRPLTDTVK